MIVFSSSFRASWWPWNAVYRKRNKLSSAAIKIKLIHSTFHHHDESRSTWTNCIASRDYPKQ